METETLRPAESAPRRRAGFSLIELLVVVGVIALLVAILVPVLFQAREKSRASACISNYHQIGGAIQMYATDNDGDTPPDGGSFGGILTDCVPYLKTTNVFVCPDDFDRVREGRPGSYRMASLYQGLPINCGWKDPYSASGAIANTATTTLLYEAEQDFAQAPIQPTFRHSGGTQILFFDGHIKWLAGVSKDADD